MSVSFSLVVAALCFFLNKVDQSTAILCYQTQTTIGGATVDRVQVSEANYGCGVVYDRVCSPSSCEFVTTYTTFEKKDAICAKNLNQPQCVWDGTQQLTKVSICCDSDDCNQKITATITPATCGSPQSSNATTTTPLTAPGGFTTTTTTPLAALGGITTTTATLLAAQGGITNTTATPLAAPGAVTTTTTTAAPGGGMNATESSNNSTTSTNAPSGGGAVTSGRSLLSSTPSSSERVGGIRMVVFLGVAVAVLLGIYTTSNIL